MPVLENEKQERYCQYFTAAKQPNITVAMMEGGGYSKNYAQKSGYKFHQQEHIQERLAELREERRERLGTEDQQDRVITELSSIGFSNIVDVLISMRASGGAQVKDLEKLTPAQKASIMEITFFEVTNTIEKIKLHPKVASLKLLGEHEGMFRPEKGGGIMFFMDADYGGEEGAEAES